MIWRIDLAPSAQRDLRRLDPQVARRVLLALARYAESKQGDMRRLRGEPEEWRLRVGDWRVRLAFERETETMVVLRVLPRGRAYRDR